MEKSVEKSTKNKRDVRVELLRCAACFMVILTHIGMVNIVDGHPLKTDILVDCLAAVSVGVFFLISGFFLYNKKRTAWQTIRYFLEKILLPTILVVIVTMLLEKWLTGEEPLADCLKHADIPRILKATIMGVLQMSSDYWGSSCGHLWYITEYMKLMLYVPVIMLLTRYAGNKILFYLVALNIYYYLKLDLAHIFGGTGFLPQLEPFLQPSQALLVAGFLLYQNREKLSARKSTGVALFAACTVSVLWMFYAQTREIIVAGEVIPPYFSTWLSGTGLISAILLAASVLSLPGTWEVWNWIRKPILFLGKRSFLIYLLHYLVVAKLATRGIAERFQILIPPNRSPVVYYAVYGTVIFVSTLLLVLVIEAVMNGAGRLKNIIFRTIKTS